MPEAYDASETGSTGEWGGGGGGLSDEAPEQYLLPVDVNSGSFGLRGGEGGPLVRRDIDVLVLLLHVHVGWMIYGC